MSEEIDGKWFLFAENETVRTWHMLEPDGPTRTKIHVRQEMKNPEDFLATIEEEYSINAGRKFGQGAAGAPIGRVPLSLYFSSGLAEAAKQSDTAFQKRFWNDPEHRKLRLKDHKL